MNNVTTINQTQVKPLDPQAIEALILGGDLSRLTPVQKVAYYNKVCEAVGLNPLTKPFDYLKLNGREVLYANKGCGEQLRQVHKIGLKITDKVKIDDVYVVTAEALDPHGRTDSATGAVNVAGLKGEALANAMMKAETKAKRRVTLSICGLNMLDDTEVDSIPGARREAFQTREQIMQENGFKEPDVWTFPFGSFRGKSCEQVHRDPKLGIPALQKARRLTKERIEENDPYEGFTIPEMEAVVHIVEQYLDGLPESEFEEQGEFNSFKGGVIRPKE